MDDVAQVAPATEAHGRQDDDSAPFPFAAPTGIGIGIGVGSNTLEASPEPTKPSTARLCQGVGVATALAAAGLAAAVHNEATPCWALGLSVATTAVVLGLWPAQANAAGVSEDADGGETAASGA